MIQALIIFLVIPFIILFMVVSSQEKRDKEIMEKEKLYAIETYDYCGGCDLVAKDTNVELKWGMDNVLVINYLWAGITEYIPYNKIDRVYAKTERQIKEDVTLTRLALFGVFAFGMKKETQESKYYLVISYENADGIEQNLILAAGTLLQNDLNKYNQILRNYRTEMV